DRSGAGRADQAREGGDVFDLCPDRDRDRKSVVEGRTRCFDRRVLVYFFAFAGGGFVVGVVGEVGDPVVGAGAGGGGVEFFRGVFAVGVDRGGARFQGFAECLFGACSAVGSVDVDRSGAGRADQAREGGDVFDLCPDRD